MLGKKLILETTDQLYDRYNDRQYAFETGTKRCFVIIDQGRAMLACGLPQFQLFSAVKPFAEPAYPIEDGLDWQISGGSEKSMKIAVLS